jgi:hypothetical protein
LLQRIMTPWGPGMNTNKRTTWAMALPPLERWSLRVTKINLDASDSRL